MRPRLLTGLEFFSYNATKDFLCRSTIHFTLPYIFNRNTYNCQSHVARDRWQRSELAKSIRRRSTDQYHSRPKRIFVRTMCFGKAKRTQTKAFSVQWRKVSPLFDGAVVRALRTEHCFVTWDTVLMFSLPFLKQLSIAFFEIGIQNWQSSSLPLFV